MSSFVPFVPETRRRRVLSGPRMAVVAAGLLLLLLGCLPRTAHANGCYWTDAWGKWTATPPKGNNNGSIVRFGAVTMDFSDSTVVGEYPGGGNPAPTTDYTEVSRLQCDADTKAYLVNKNGGAPTDPAGTVFPTQIPRVAYKIKVNGTAIPAAGHGSFAWNNSGSPAYKLDYYITQLYPPYYQLPANTPMAELHTKVCADANVDSAGRYVSCKSYQDEAVQQFAAGSLTIHSHGCALAINDKDITVTLPTIQTQDLTQTGTTLGKTRFTVRLISCAPQTHVKITLNSTAKSSTVAGLIKPTQGSGYAQNVGVQLLQADKSTPVSFGTELDEGQPSGSGTGGSGPNMDIDFYAQYYQTDTPASGGQVKGLATFTVKYY